MKRSVSFVKFIIRFMGSMCIVAAIALLFLSTVIQVEGFKSKEFRTAYNRVEQFLTQEEEWLLKAINKSDSKWKEDLKENDLPYKKAEITNWFRDIDSIAKEILDKDISPEEVLVLTRYAPELINDLKNLMETDYVLDDAVTTLVVNLDSYFYGISSELIHDGLEDASEYFDLITVFCHLIVGLFAFIALLTAIAAIGHLFNKGKWIKYILLGFVALLAAGGYIGLPIVSETSEVILYNTMGVDGTSIRMTSVPIFVLILMLIPVVLDILEKIWLKKLQTIALNRPAAETAQTTSRKPLLNIPKKPAAYKAPAQENTVEKIVSAEKTDPNIFFDRLKNIGQNKPEKTHFVADLPAAVKKESHTMCNIPVWHRYTLTIEEAAGYYRIDADKLRLLIDRNPHETFYLMNDNQVLIKREKFERYLDQITSV